MTAEAEKQVKSFLEDLLHSDHNVTSDHESCYAMCRPCKAESLLKTIEYGF